MNRLMYELFLKDNFNYLSEEEDNGFIKTGSLVDMRTGQKIPIRNYIPRFSDEQYCQSFGFQWKKFSDLQHDTKTGMSFSYERLSQNTKWDLDEVSGASVLECGCGPGRFTEILTKKFGFTVAVDMTKAVDINLANIKKQKNLLLLQADFTKMEFFFGKFDYVFCYGVLQHTPCPETAFNKLIDYLKPGGKVSADIYRKRFLPTAFSTPKYFWRPITKKMEKQKLLKIIQWYIPKYIGFDTLIKKIPKIGCVLSGLIPIPCYNYLDRYYSKEQRIENAILDTFDALSPDYDIPKTKKQVQKWLEGNPAVENYEIFYGSNGIVINATKKDKYQSI